MKLYTIGFTKTSARHFFGRLQKAGVTRIVDTRLHKDSQLAGFAKQADLPYFLDAVGGIGYAAADPLAPTADILDAYRKKCISWREYENLYLSLLESREVEKRLDPSIFDYACLLCSESTPECCHRRLAAEYLSRAWGGIQIVHL
jgi:uncharacterized protein (DUF488 family)